MPQTLAHWGSAGKGRSAPSEGRAHGSVSDCSEGLWGRRGDDPVDHRGDLRHRGIVTLIRGAVLYGIVLVIIGLLIGRGA